MSTGTRARWAIVSDEGGRPLWEKRAGDVVAQVQLTQSDGSPAWRYYAGIGKWFVSGYKDSMRSAKVAASKALEWYAVREADFKRVARKLRSEWLSIGLESVDPEYGYAWDGKAERWSEAGIIWTWDYDLTMWRSGAWRLWYNHERGWMLRYPDNHVQTFQASTRHYAMREAAMWIRLALEE